MYVHPRLYFPFTYLAVIDATKCEKYELGSCILYGLQMALYK